MLLRCFTTAAVAVGTVVPGVAEAQRAGSTEFGIVTQYMVYDADVGLDDTGAIGIRGGVFVIDDLQVELQVSHAEPGISGGPVDGGRSWITHQLWQLRGVYAHRMGRSVQLLFGGGFAYDNFYRERSVGGRGVGTCWRQPHPADSHR